MKAITLWQPWATLIIIEAKKIETRSWTTNYRGPLGIHAGSSTAGFDLVRQMQGPQLQYIVEALAAAGYTCFEDLPLGVVLGTANLANCTPMTILKSAFVGSPHNNQREHAFGDWRDGRHGLEMRDVKRFVNPIKARGGQQLWNWFPSEAELKHAMGAA